MSIELNPLQRQQLIGLEPSPPTLLDIDAIELVDQLDLDIYFSAHRTEADLGQPQEFRDVLKSSDIFLPEISDWDEYYLRIFSKVAKGDYKAYERVKRDLQVAGNPVTNRFDRAMFAALYDTKVDIACVDTPESHPYNRRKVKIMGVDRAAALAGEDFDETVTNLGQWYEGFNDLVVERDNYMLSVFGPIVQSVIERNRKLSARQAGGEAVRATMLIGGNHIGLYDAFSHKLELQRDEGESPSFECTPHYGFSDTPFSYGQQIYGRFIRGIDVDDLLVARQLVFGRLYDQEVENGSAIGLDEFKAREMSRIDQLDFAELKQLWESVSDARPSTFSD
jgi:hypothetical protein